MKVTGICRKKSVLAILRKFCVAHNVALNSQCRFTTAHNVVSWSHLEAICWSDIVRRYCETTWLIFAFLVALGSDIFLYGIFSTVALQSATKFSHCRFRSSQCRFTSSQCRFLVALTSDAILWDASVRRNNCCASSDIVSNKVSQNRRNRLFSTYPCWRHMKGRSRKTVK